MKKSFILSLAVILFFASSCKEQSPQKIIIIDNSAEEQAAPATVEEEKPQVFTSQDLKTLQLTGHVKNVVLKEKTNFVFNESSENMSETTTYTADFSEDGTLTKLTKRSSYDSSTIRIKRDENNRISYLDDNKIVYNADGYVIGTRYNNPRRETMEFDVLEENRDYTLGDNPLQQISERKYYYEVMCDPATETMSYRYIDTDETGNWTTRKHTERVGVNAMGWEHLDITETRTITYY